jgi:hypothetical protein
MVVPDDCRRLEIGEALCMRLVPAGIIRVGGTRTPAHILQGFLVGKMQLSLAAHACHYDSGFLLENIS